VGSFIEDALLIIGVEHFLDWMRHTAQGGEILACAPPGGGVEKSGENDSGAGEDLHKSSAQLKVILQSAQTRAAAHFNPLDP
jgi:hypothetical protein